VLILKEFREMRRVDHLVPNHVLCQVEASFTGHAGNQAVKHISAASVVCAVQREVRFAFSANVPIPG
jgi:hypothetical protein